MAKGTNLCLLKDDILKDKRVLKNTPNNALKTHHHIRHV
ncbi:hypothetical protein HPHPH1_1013 [Helicobacter pylori Hp H-1]|uniref:Uncharacterized protein n=1 Tax=Helicobacter pylori Hp H-1 TaxID=992058 RepID=M7S317_HELPX|nr:hypothetical protein HPHPH1_1013 [Helicobacter pylori Hp H-1]